MARPIAGLGVSILALVALAACSGSSPPPPVVPPPLPPPVAAPEPSPPAVVSVDQQFIDTAAAAGASEVETGKMATQQAGSRAVKSYGSRMVHDHTAANKRLMALAQREKLTPNPPPMDTGSLAGLSGAEFDKAYMTSQVQAHQSVVGAFEAEAKGGQNAALRSFARSSLPMLRNHLKQAEALAKRVGS